MTDAEWFDAVRPYGSLVYLSERPGYSERKARLLGVACCRRVLEWMPDPTARAVIDRCERFADGGCPVSILVACQSAILDRLSLLPMTTAEEREARDFLRAVDWLTSDPVELGYCLEYCQEALYGCSCCNPEDSLFQLDLLRDIFGNPFRPVAFAPAWRTSAAVGLALSMYTSRDFALMPILADALEDAGCDHPDVLEHCRDPDGVHVRGCWVVDLVLGKS